MKLLNGNGELVDISDIQRDDISIDVIANSLSKLCRYTGNPRVFYSVAEHSVHLSHVVPKHLRRAAMLHDAPEEWVADLPHPVKVQCPQYSAVEKPVQNRICSFYGVTEEELRELEHYDRNICGDEMYVLFNYLRPDHKLDFELIGRIETCCWEWQEAYTQYVNRFIEVF